MVYNVDACTFLGIMFVSKDFEPNKNVFMEKVVQLIFFFVGVDSVKDPVLGRI